MVQVKRFDKMESAMKTQAYSRLPVPCSRFRRNAPSGTVVSEDHWDINHYNTELGTWVEAIEPVDVDGTERLVHTNRLCFRVWSFGPDFSLDGGISKFVVWGFDEPKPRDMLYLKSTKWYVTQQGGEFARHIAVYPSPNGWADAITDIQDWMMYTLQAALTPNTPPLKTTTDPAMKKIIDRANKAANPDLREFIFSRWENRVDAESPEPLRYKSPFCGYLTPEERAMFHELRSPSWGIPQDQYSFRDSEERNTPAASLHGFHVRDDFWQTNRKDEF